MIHYKDKKIGIGEQTDKNISLKREKEINIIVKPNK